MAREDALERSHQENKDLAERGLGPGQHHLNMTLPDFDVHQDFDNVLMNGERDGQGNGTKSEIHGRV